MQTKTIGSALSVDGKPLEHWLTQRTIAAQLEISERTLERMRAEDTGPRFAKAGRRVLYRLADVEEWLEANSFASTVEARQKQGSTM